MPGAIIRPQGFTFQPQYAPSIDVSNPITKGLVDAVLPIGGRITSVATEGTPASRFDNWTDTAGPTVNYSLAGQSKRYDRGANQYSSRNWSPLTQVKECSFLVYWLPESGAASAGAAFSYGSSSTNNPFVIIGWATGNNPYFRVQDTSATNQTIQGTAGKLTTQTTTPFPHVQICVRSQSNNFARTYVDGIIDNNTTATTMGAWSTDRTAVGGLLRAAFGSSQSNYNFHLALVWGRALNPLEVLSLSNNPWQVFATPIRPFFSNAPAAAAFLARQGLNINQSINRGSTF